MPIFETRQSERLDLTSHAGLALVGQCCEVVQLDQLIDSSIPVRGGIKTSDVVKSMIGLLSLGKSDFDAIEPFRKDGFFRKALNIVKVPASAWLRQRLNRVAGWLRELTDELSLRLIERTEAPISAHEGFVCTDIDTFVMDNSGTKKELVSRTYKGVDGYTPIAGYLGNEGWCIGLELRAGKQHSACESEYFFQRLFARIERLVPADQPVLWRQDSGFDSARLLFELQGERERCRGLGRQFHFLGKWNPRKQEKTQWVRWAEDEQAFVQAREGKRIALIERPIERAWGGKRHTFRLVVRIIERTIDRKGQMLLEPDIELEGWWTSLPHKPQTIIELYKHHGTHEQFHSEFKTDLDLERLPSGKFDTNDAILHLALFVYNCLRLLGQLGLGGHISPVRHPATRRRLRTVLQEIMYRAARVVRHARKLILDFGRGVESHARVFIELQQRLRLDTS